MKTSSLWTVWKDRAMFSPAQSTMVRQMMVLIAGQWILLLAVVYGVHSYFPHRVHLLFQNVWLDILVYILVTIACIMTIFSYTQNSLVRLATFLLLGIMLALVISAQFNRMMYEAKDPVQLEESFRVANGVTLVYFLIVLGSTPLLLRYVNGLVVLSSQVFVGFLICFFISFFIPYGSQVFLWLLYTFLSIFVVFLVTDTVIIVQQCNSHVKHSCDPIRGATVLYVDLVNIVQKLFMILAYHNRR